MVVNELAKRSATLTKIENVMRDTRAELLDVKTEYGAHYLERKALEQIAEILNIQIIL